MKSEKCVASFERLIYWWWGVISKSIRLCIVKNKLWWTCQRNVFKPTVCYEVNFFFKKRISINSLIIILKKYFENKCLVKFLFHLNINWIVIGDWMRVKTGFAYDQVFSFIDKDVHLIDQWKMYEEKTNEYGCCGWRRVYFFRNFEESCNPHRARQFFSGSKSYTF